MTILKPGVNEVVLVVAKIILIVVGLFILSISFFHGPDINLATLVGVSLLLTSTSSFTPIHKAQKLWGVLIAAICLTFYLYFLIVLFDGESFTIATSDYLSLVPILCLIYLLYFYIKALRSASD